MYVLYKKFTYRFLLECESLRVSVRTYDTVCECYCVSVSCQITTVMSECENGSVGVCVSGASE